MSRSGAIALWLPPLALMALIFAFSAQSDLDSGPGVLGLVTRKLVHLAVFALLTVLLWRPLAARMSAPRAALAACLIASAYAVTDEWHQSFVEGRVGSPLDWAIDTLGAALAALRLRAVPSPQVPA